MTKDRRLIFTSEGIAHTGGRPVHPPATSLRRPLPGRLPGAAGVPPDPDPTRRRPNLGFESAGVTPNGRLPLHRDARTRSSRTGPRRRSPPAARRGSCATTCRAAGSTASGPTQTTRSRSHRIPTTAFSVNGVVELLPLDSRCLIAMERSFSVGAPDTRQHDQALASSAVLGARQPYKSADSCDLVTPRRSRSQRRGPDLRRRGCATAVSRSRWSATTIAAVAVSPDPLPA